MKDNGDSECFEDGEMLAVMRYNRETYQYMVKSTLEDVEYMPELNIWWDALESKGYPLWR